MTRKIGRPSKLTTETKGKLVNALSAGAHIEIACVYAGITRTTYYEWAAIARNGTPENPAPKEYLELAETIEQATVQGEITTLASIKKASADDWRAGAWLLERRHPDRWANSHRIQVEVEKNIEKVLDVAESVLPSDLYYSLLEAINAQEPTA